MEFCQGSTFIDTAKQKEKEKREGRGVGNVF